MVDAQHEFQIGSEHSIVVWSQYCRDIAVSYFINNLVRIGDPRNIVDIEESLFSRFLEVVILQPRKAFCC